MNVTFFHEPSKVKLWYFDAGCSTWYAKNMGGSSLNYFTSIWKRLGLSFDQIEGWDNPNVMPSKWLKEVPNSVLEAAQHRVIYHNQYIGGTPDSIDDYVATL